MRIPPEPEEYQEKFRKPNRLKKLLPKTHKIFTESGRSLKGIWQRIVEESEEKKED